MKIHFPKMISHFFILLALLIASFGSSTMPVLAVAPSKGLSTKLSSADWEQVRALLPASLPNNQQAYIKASNTDLTDDFGYSIALDGDTLAVGAYREASNATGINKNQANNSIAEAGAVYVFTRNGTTWSQQAYIKASNTGKEDNFGWSVALSGDTLAVGAPFEESNATGVDGNQYDNSASGAGAVYIFARSGGDWSQQAYIKASNTNAGDQFGYSLALSNDTLAVGANHESSSTTGVEGGQSDNSAFIAGAVYIFTRSGTAWSQQNYVKASNTDAGDEFGISVALSDNTLAVGALLEDSNATSVDGDQNDNSVSAAGAVYVFTRSGTTWSQQAYIKASNTGKNDNFSHAVALSGDTLAVGANGESSNATGVDGNQNDNSDSGSGAVYVFTRSGSIWSQQAYIKASNTNKADIFGWSVALDGDTLAAGAYGEDSKATGINGNQNDNSMQASGAVYVFTRSGTTWSQKTYVKSSNTDAGDFFGQSVALSDDTLAIGANGESSKATGINGNETDNSLRNAGAVYVFAPVGADYSDLMWNQSYDIKYDTWVGVKENLAFASIASAAHTSVPGYRKATSGAFTFKPGSLAFTSFKWISYRGPDQGKAAIYVDGVLEKTVDLYRATPQWQYNITVSGLSNKAHTVVIKALSSKNALSNNVWVVVDGFTIGTTNFDDNDILTVNGLFKYGSWRGLIQRSSSRFGAYRVSGKKNASAKFSFVGLGFNFVTARGPTYGRAAIYVDGVKVKTVDLYHASQQWEYSVPITGLSYKYHTVVIKVLGTKNSASRGTGIVCDGFEVY